VIFAGLDEVIEIRHRANSKRVFAAGALRAAAYVIQQPPGLYSAADLFC
jgi:4-hydroxy-tetrahydrodipicolinate reductase